jgi:hypothetical protein
MSRGMDLFAEDDRRLWTDSQKFSEMGYSAPLHRTGRCQPLSAHASTRQDGILSCCKLATTPNKTGLYLAKVRLLRR